MPSGIEFPPVYPEPAEQSSVLKVLQKLRRFVECEAEKRLLKAYGFTLRSQLSYFGAKTLWKCLTAKQTTAIHLSKCIKVAISETKLLRHIQENIDYQKQLQYYSKKLTRIQRQKRNFPLLDSNYLVPQKNVRPAVSHPKVFGQLFKEIKHLMQQTGLLDDRNKKNVIKRDQDGKFLSVTSFLSPSIASIFPKDNTNGYEYSQLSPSLLSFYDTKDDAASIPSILKNFGMKKYEADAVTDLIAEVVGARKILDDVLVKLKDLHGSGTLQRFAKIKRNKLLRAALSKSSNAINLKQLLEFRRRIIDNDRKVEEIWQRLNPQIKSKQKDDLQKNGFFFLDLNQLQTIYSDKLQKTNSNVVNNEFLRYKRKAFHHSLDNMTVFELLEYLATDPINYVMDTAFQQTILRPSVFGFTILKPTIVGPAVLSPSIFSPQVLSIEFLSPGILSPFIGNVDILTLSILSGDILSPNILSPPILQLSVLDFNVLSPSLFS